MVVQGFFLHRVYRCECDDAEIAEGVERDLKSNVVIKHRKLYLPVILVCFWVTLHV